MKNFLVKGFAVLLLVFLLAFSASVSASVTLSPSTAIARACICDTETIYFTASNPSASGESVLFAVSGDEPWGVAAPASAYLAPNSSQNVYAFITPDCFASLGTYSFALNAESPSSRASSRIALTVSPCVSVENPSAPNSVCAGEAKNFVLVLRNLSRTAGKNYSLFLSGEAAAAAAAPSRVYVGANSSAEFLLTIDATRLGTGTHSLSVRAVSIYEPTGQPTADSVVFEFGFSVENCQKASLTPDAGAARLLSNACAGQEIIVPLTVSNEGASADTFSLEVSSDSASASPRIIPSSLYLRPGESKNANLILVTPLGDSRLTVKAVSALTQGSNEIVLGASGRRCFDAALSLGAVPESFCSEDGGEASVSLRNSGDSANFSLSVSSRPSLPSGPSGISLSESSVFLAKGESAAIPLVFAKGLPAGNYSITATASVSSAGSGGTGSVSSTSSFAVEKCFGVKIVGSDGDVCQCGDESFPFQVINVGTRGDGYYVKRESGPDWLSFPNVSDFEIAAGGVKTLFPYVFSCNAEPAVYQTVFGVFSKTHQVSDKLCINVTVHSKEECYGALLSMPDSEAAEECASVVVPIRIKNSGLAQNTFYFKASGADWAIVKPDFLTLEKSEEREIYLTLSPPLNTLNKTFDISLAATSRGITSVRTVEVSVVAKGSLKQKPSASPLPLPAEVSVENNSLIVKTLPDAVVRLYSEKVSVKLFAGKEGIASLPLNSSGEWRIELSLQNHTPVSLKYNASIEGGQPFTGFFVADASTMPALIAILLAVFAGLYLLYWFSQA